MENKETIVEIRGVGIKEGKSGNKYFSIETDKGTVTCFEKAITDELQKNVGKRVKVEIVANERGFKNLRKFLGVAAEAQAEQPAAAKAETFAEARAEKNKSMYVAYCKDLVIAGKSVEEAVDIVKFIIKSFEEAEPTAELDEEIKEEKVNC
jgi:hypothetical protein